MKELTIKELANRLGYSTSEEMLEKHGTYASRMSQMKRRNPNGYKHLIMDIILNEKGIPVDDVIDYLQTLENDQ